MLMLDRQEVTRQFHRLTDLIQQLDLSLFAAEEAEVLGLDKEKEHQNAIQLIRKAGDLLCAFPRLNEMAGAFLQDVDSAAEAAIKNPFDTVEEAPEDGYPGSELFYHPIAFRQLAGRIAAVYGVENPEYSPDLTPGRNVLLAVCQNIGSSVQHLVEKKCIEVPSREHAVKYVLYSVIAAFFPDALSDGGVTFPGIVSSKPDVGIPRLKACVELKIARNLGELDRSIDGINVDQSKYGSGDYDMFISLFYTADATITREVVEEEQAKRLKNMGAVPRFTWISVVAHGPLR